MTLVDRVADGVARVFDGVGSLFFGLLFAAGGEEGTRKQEAGEEEFGDCLWIHDVL